MKETQSETRQATGKPRDPHRLDQVFYSQGRVKILLFLANTERASLAEVARACGQSNSSAGGHLDRLVEIGVVEEKDYGRMRVFRLRTDSERVRRLRELIFDWENISKPTIQSKHSSLNTDRPHQYFTG